MWKVRQTQINAIEKNFFFKVKQFLSRGDPRHILTNKSAWSPLEKNFLTQKFFCFLWHLFVFADASSCQLIVLRQIFLRLDVEFRK